VTGPVVHLRDHLTRAALDLGLESPHGVDTLCGADAPGGNVCDHVAETTCPTCLKAEHARLQVLVRTAEVILASPTLRPAAAPQLTRVLELADQLRTDLKRATSQVDDVIGRPS
jgi:hypothetical protein